MPQGLPVWRLEKVDGQGEGEGIMGGIKETPLMRNPVLLNRYRKSSIKPPGGGLFIKNLFEGMD